MKWQRGGRSANLEDRRGSRMGGRGMKLGAGGTVIGIIVLLVFGQDYLGVMSGGGSIPGLQAGAGGPASGGAPAGPDADAELVDFVSFVLDDIQGTWTTIFRSQGKQYEEAKLVLFTDAVASACGSQSSATGPFYCPGDHKAYIDLGFYRELRDRFGAPGDFAQAYVLAHEIGHHVQNITGISERAQRLAQNDPAHRNEYSIRQELQADCYAGIWAHATSRRDVLEEGDIEEGLAAAAAIGDDRLQKQATGRVHPESWTHGSSAQRVRWFKRGFDKGEMDACDTFGAREL
ncbi:MAG: zinc metallopeptidase [Deltaproteobacteria bacterium]|nr:zinc metallopeptidase [Deltaproteobacteria bacterium]